MASRTPSRERARLWRDTALGDLDPRWQVDVLFALQDLLSGLTG